MRIFDRRKDAENDPFCGIGLGDRVKDTLSGFTGVCIARSEHMTGCNQLYVLPSSIEDNVLKEGHWFDVERMEKLEEKVVTVAPRRTGSDIPSPRAEGRRA